MGRWMGWAGVYGMVWYGLVMKTTTMIDDDEACFDERHDRLRHVYNVSNINPLL